MIAGLAMASGMAAGVGAAAAIAGETVFTTGVVAGVAFVAAAVSGFVAVEVVEHFLAMLRERSSVSVMRVVAVVDVTEEAMGAMEPGTGSDEDPVGKPVRTVIAIGGAIVGRVVEVAIRAYGGPSNVDADGNLG
jgi:hypothetical protein